MSSSYFCSVPWEYLEVVSTGDVYVCCNGRQKKPIGNIWKSALSTLWNSATANDVRQSIRAGDFANCGPCIYLDKKGGRVKERTKLNLFERSYAENLLFPYPKILWLLIDRSCQLKCGSCRKDFIVESKTPKIFELRDKVLQDPVMQGLETLWIDGSGEPFMSDAHLDLIQRSPQLLPNTNLGILTNGLLFEKTYRSLFPEAQHKIQHVTVSIDAAIPQTYKLNRGADWNVLTENLEFIANIKRIKGLTFKIVMAVQQNNWRQMIWFASMASHLGATAWFTALTNWGTWTDAEYKTRAVHLPGHPEHAEFCEMLKAPELQQKHVLQYVLV